jgi:hypothetical protein
MVPNIRSRVAGKRFPLKFSLDAPSLLVFEQEDYTMTTAITTRNFNGTPLVFREDGWFNMTKAANSFGKDVHEFLRLPSTKEYNAALEATGKIPEAFRAVRGQGTWAHPKLAVFFARWLDVKFAVWCDAMIDDILKGNAEVTITKPEVSSVLALSVVKGPCTIHA